MVTEDDARSSPLKLIVSQIGITITAQPANTSGVIGGNASFSVMVHDSYGGLVQYNWQMQIEPGGDWLDMAETTGFYEGVATANLTIKNIDNFLVSLPALNVRCRINYPGTAPIFSDPAALSVTNFLTTSGPSLAVVRACRSGVVDPLVFHVSAPVPSFAGPYTYLWNFVSGDAGIIIDDPTVNPARFDTNSVSVGNHVAVWTVTVSNGPTTITSDRITLAAVAQIMQQSSSDVELVSDADPSATAIEIQINDSLTFIGPWTPIVQISKRMVAPPSITVVSPAGNPTAVNLNGPITGGAGTMLLLYAEAQNLNPDPVLCCRNSAPFGTLII